MSGCFLCGVRCPTRGKNAHTCPTCYVKLCAKHAKLQRCPVCDTVHVLPPPSLQVDRGQIVQIYRLMSEIAESMRIMAEITRKIVGRIE